MDQKLKQQLEKVENQFVEKIADNMNTFGVSDTMGRVLGIIYMNRKPMTLDELSEVTGMSKTRMSQITRQMLEFNIAEKVFEKGVRKDLYTVEQDYYQTFISLLTSNWRKAINKNRVFEQRLDAELLDMKENQTLDQASEEWMDEMLHEKEEWLQYHDWINRVMAFFESGEIFKYVPKSKEEQDAE